MQKRVINVGILGLGTVGAGVLRYFFYNQDLIDKKAGIPVRLIKAVARSSEKERGFAPALIKGLTLVYQDRLEGPAWRQVVDDTDIDIIVELMGTGISEACIREALWKGKSVVTANKKVISTFGSDLMKLARERGAALRFEAAVGGGTPVLQPLDETLAGSDIAELAAIVNGTTNFILSSMTYDGKEYAEALGEAQRLGLAEADPTEDVEGGDAVSKLKILIMMAFGEDFPRSSIYCRGIARQAGTLPTVTKNDIAYAGKHGYVVKLLAVARRTKGGITAWVQPMLVHSRNPMATVNYTSNAVSIRKVLGEVLADEVIFYGIGAGAAPTASAVVADIINIAEQMAIHPAKLGVDSYYQQFAEALTVSIDDVSFRHYLHFVSTGGTEVLRKIVESLARESIEIILIESDRHSSGQASDIYMLVGPACVSKVTAALREIMAQTTSAEILPGVVSIPVYEQQA